MHVIDTAEIQSRKHCSAHEWNYLWEPLRPLMRKARRFVFDDEASAFAGRFIRDFGPAIIENYPFALPPYEVTYIEYNVDALLNAVGRRKVGMEYDPSDEYIGHLIHRNRVATFLQDSTGRTEMHPVAMGLHSDNYVRGQFDQTSIGEDIHKKLAFALGSTANDLHSMGRMRGAVAARRWVNNLEYHASGGFDELLSDDTLRGYGNGTARDLVALLLLLNRQRDYGVGIKEVAPKGVMYKGKRRVYMAHSLVTLTTEDYGRITRSFAAGGHHESPRRHQVRGFFRHYHKVRGCEHAFIEDDQPLHWTCQHCGTVRVWVHDHERGDASKGYTTKEYVVTDLAAGS